MESEFLTYPFADLLSNIVDNRGKTCPVVEYGFPLIATNCIKNDTLYPSFEKVRYVSQETYETWFRGHPEPGDMIFVTKGSPGNVCWTPAPINFCIAQDMVGIRAKLEIIEPKYLFALLRHPKTQAQILNMHVGTLIPHFKKGDFKNLYLQIHKDRMVQKAIGDIYFSFCEKIELNRQMNETLEAMAQALFKSWFVDFEPVIDNALGAGNPIPPALQKRAAARAALGAQRKPLPTTIQAHFPNRFTYNEELGWIPEGWQVSKLKDCTSKIGSGATPRGGSSVYIDEGTRLVRSQNIYDSSFRWNGIVCISDEAAEKLKGVTLTENDVLINITGDSILRTCLVDPSVLPARVNQHVAILRPKGDLSKYYLHQYIVRSEYKTYLLGFNAGGSRKAITKGHLEEAKILLPDDTILKEYATMVEYFFDRKNQNNLQTRNLENLRDTLLPKLLSGQLRVPDVEREVEAVL